MNKTKNVNIGIVGVAGRMGMSIATAALKSANIKIKAGSEHKKHKMLVKILLCYRKKN